MHVSLHAYNKSASQTLRSHRLTLRQERYDKRENFSSQLKYPIHFPHSLNSLFSCYTFKMSKQDDEITVLPPTYEKSNDVVHNEIVEVLQEGDNESLEEG